MRTRRHRAIYWAKTGRKRKVKHSEYSRVLKVVEEMARGIKKRLKPLVRWLVENKDDIIRFLEKQNTTTRKGE